MGRAGNRSDDARIRHYVKRRRFTQGKRADQKRAIVTLAEGDSIEIFEAGK